MIKFSVKPLVFNPPRLSQERIRIKLLLKYTKVPKRTIRSQWNFKPKESLLVQQLPNLTWHPQNSQSQYQQGKVKRLLKNYLTPKIKIQTKHNYTKDLRITFKFLEMNKTPMSKRHFHSFNQSCKELAVKRHWRKN